MLKQLNSRNKKLSLRKGSTTLSSHERGFTLVELLVVIGILGVLAAAVLTAINPQAQFAKARNSARKASLKQIADAVERYKITTGTYPVTTTWCGAAGSYWAGGCADPANYVPGLVSSGELKVLPQDPRVLQTPNLCGDARYASFLYYSNGTDFKIMAYCTPEGPLSSTDPFVDPIRPTYSWAIYSPGGANW